MVRREQTGWSVTQFLQQIFGAKAGVVQARGLIAINGRPCGNWKLKLRHGDSVIVDEVSPKKAPGPRRNDSLRKESRAKRESASEREVHVVLNVRYLDDHIVVTDKPAGLTTVRHRSEVEEMGNRAKKFLPPTLVDLLPSALPPKDRHGRIRAVHRLDRETTGVVVLARTPQAETSLGKQFRAHSIERQYLAVVRGKAEQQTIESYLVADRGDHRRGSGPKEEGQHAITHIRVVEQLGDFTLVECEIDTGRTHQVRIHLGEVGTPLCGERIYDRPVHGTALPDDSGATRPMLHGALLVVTHPASGERLRFESPLPRDMQDLIKRLRGRKRSK